MQEMIIDLRDIIQETKTYRFILADDWWVPSGKNDPVDRFQGPISVVFQIYRAGERFVLEGNITGTLSIICDRCLRPYPFDLMSDFRIFLSSAIFSEDEAELELQADDMDISFLREDRLNVEDVVREQIYLSVPAKCLCTDNCKGLCPSCGINLNVNKCNCQVDSGHPGFLLLKRIRDSLPSQKK